MKLTAGQRVIWMYPTRSGSIVPIGAKVVNVVAGRVVIRVTKKQTGEVYFKAVDREQLRAVASADQLYARG